MTDQEAFLAGHCPLTGRYFEPWSIRRVVHIVYIREMSILERCSYWRGIGIRGVYKEGCPYSIYQRDVHIREVFVLAWYRY